MPMLHVVDVKFYSNIKSRTVYNLSHTFSLFLVFTALLLHSHLYKTILDKNIKTKEKMKLTWLFIFFHTTKKLRSVSKINIITTTKDLLFTVP